MIGPLPLVLVALVLFCPLAMAQLPLTHPVPQQVEQLEGSFQLNQLEAQLESDDPDAPLAASIEARLSELFPASPERSLIVGLRGDSAVTALPGDQVSELPEVAGAYHLRLNQQGLLLVGQDERGLWNGYQTLRQLIAASKDGQLSGFDIIDWPAIPHRGIVEGFYGTPWSQQDRLSLLQFCGSLKLNCYLYGPKDDPYHSSPHWRDPYPEEEAKQIAELAQVAAANQVEFYWAIHPGKDIQWTPEDFQAVLHKFELMHQLGVRAFALFFDDISGQGTDATRQAELLNFLQAEFVEAKGDVAPLIFCPTEYNRGWANSAPGSYLDILGEQLHPSIEVMWTGNSVISDMDRPTLEWINARIQRNAFIWWNFPVSDYVRDHLLLGPVYGNEGDIGSLMDGFVSNPMERAEASKIALFSVADYSWNPPAYESGPSWHAAIEAVIPKAAEAFATFARHNSDLGPNNHGYRREESVQIAPLVEAVLEQVRADGSTGPRGEELQREFEIMAAAPASIRAGSDNQNLLEEIAPWLDSFEALGHAGAEVLAGLDALTEGHPEAAWEALARANAARAQMRQIDASENQNPYQPGVKVGSLVLTPAVDELFQLSNARLLSPLVGHSLLPARVIQSGPEPEHPQHMIDHNPQSFAYFREIQQEGDWFGLDLGAVTTIQSVRLVQGRHDGDHDRVHRGILETSLNGEDWQTLVEALESESLELVLEQARPARYIRLRSTHAGALDGSKDDVWTAIRDFEVNPQPRARAASTENVFAHLAVNRAKESLFLSPVNEYHAFPGGGQLGIILPQPTALAGIELELGLTQAVPGLVLEVRGVDGSWHEIPTDFAEDTLQPRANALPTPAVDAVRLINQGKQTAEIQLSRFALLLESDEQSEQTAALSDLDLSTAVQLDPGKEGLELSLPVGTRQVHLFLGAEANPASLQVAARVDGRWQALPAPEHLLSTIELPAHSEAIALKANEALSVAEVVPVPEP